MNKTVYAAFAGATGVLALLAAFAGGHATAHAAPVRTVTVTKTAPPKVVTRTVTRTVTQSVPAAGGSGVACVESGGSVVPAVGAAVAGDPGLTTCTITIRPDVPAADGDQVVLTAPDGTTGSWALGPAGS